VLDRGYANFSELRACELRQGEVPRIHIPRTRVNKGKEKGRSSAKEPQPTTTSLLGR
jgi:hypothetical protein